MLARDSGSSFCYERMEVNVCMHLWLGDGGKLGQKSLVSIEFIFIITRIKKNASP